MKNLINEIVPYKIRKTFRNIFNRQFICPFCNNKTTDFTSIGAKLPVFAEKQIVGGGERKQGCPKCGSTDRERLVLLYLERQLQVFKNSQLKILHVSPEKNLGTILSDFFGKNYFAIDLFTPGYSYPDYVQNMDVLDLSFSNNFFDLIVCNHVLEHIPNDISAMKEILRVLKPNGLAVLQVPVSANSSQTYEDPSVIDPMERQRLFCQFDHVRLYGQDYPERLKTAGFYVERINISKKYSKYRLNPKEDIFTGRKLL